MNNPILIIDEDVRFGNRLAGYFKRREIYARTVNGPNVTKHLIATMNPAVAIVEYTGNSKQVENLCAFIRRMCCTTEIILTCNHRSSKIELKARRLSPAFFFDKPFNNDDLFAVVLRILEMQSQKYVARPLGFK
jgi:DNA-binding NtrC family response regulator